MYTMHDVVCPTNETELSALAKKRSSTILGGLMWLKLGRGTIRQGIDLKELHWDAITADEEKITIGAMASLRDLEQNYDLHRLTGGVVAQAMRDIVGPAFRNGASVGGSVALRAGFSDIYTLFCALDASVLLLDQEPQKLSEFATAKRERCVVKGLSVPIREQRVIYRCQRAEAGDLPLLNLCLVEHGHKLTLTCGARPSIAYQITLNDTDIEAWRSASSREQRLEALASLADQFTWADNLRASAEYRRQLFTVMLDDALNEYERR